MTCNIVPHCLSFVFASYDPAVVVHHMSFRLWPALPRHGMHGGRFGHSAVMHRQFRKAHSTPCASASHNTANVVQSRRRAFEHGARTYPSAGRAPAVSRPPAMPDILKYVCSLCYCTSSQTTSDSQTLQWAWPRCGTLDRVAGLNTAQAEGCADTCLLLRMLPAAGLGHPQCASNSARRTRSIQDLTCSHL